MNFINKLKNTNDLIVRLFRYNLKIVFANRFLYFLLVAIAFFLFVTIINLFDSDASPNEATVYYLLLFPGILLIFYPTVFGIQNDVDARIIEILFATPNYRYKIWLVRMLIIYVVVFGLLTIFSFLSSLALIEFSVLEMVYQLMFPIFFLGSLAFMFSTLIRNGYGTAVIMIVIGIIFWILSDNLQQSKWNIFLNPFDIPSEGNITIWGEIVVNNRIYLAVGTITTILYGLLNMQKREKFI